MNHRLVMEVSSRAMAWEQSNRRARWAGGDFSPKIGASGRRTGTIAEPGRSQAGATGPPGPTMAPPRTIQAQNGSASVVDGRPVGYLRVVRYPILLLSSSLVLVTFLATACDPEGSRPRARDGSVPDGGEPVDLSDEDGDTISDTDEGRREDRDTDGDGTPDYLDDDSDGDGIPDSVEAGDDDVATPPRDSDSDGIPDFIDTDSDDNGLPDAEEGTGDADGDGILDFADLDDDQDLVTDKREIEAGGGDPWLDTDGDGLPNFRDPDSDNDNILDGHEFGPDTDDDGLFDWEDLDSDGDGVPDMDEAGDADIRTPPVDTDEDGIEDFRDPDSDNDGVSDADELEAGTSRTSADTDGDGVSDLIELAAGTDPLDGTDSPRTRGDFVFVVPYEETPMPERDTLEFSTNIQFADVYFLFDITGSMSGEISAMRSAAATVLGNVSCEVTASPCVGDADCAGVTTGAGEATRCNSSGMCAEDPRTTSCIASLWSGTGRYWGGDRPDSPVSTTHAFINDLSLQPDSSATQTAMPSSANGGGADEVLFRSVQCIGDPSVCGESGRVCPAGGGTIGTPCYRDDAVRILLTLTDEQNEHSSSSASAAGGALLAEGITFVGIDADSGHEPRSHLRAIATAADSFRPDGVTPLVFDGSEAAIVSAVTTAINEIVEGIPLRVTIEAADEPDDDGDSLQFIDYLEVNTSGGACSPPDLTGPTEDTLYSDGRDDAFSALLPGTPVCWDVVPLRNDTVMPTTSPQVFKARLTVRGDGSPLDSRLVFFLIPPEIEDPGGPD